MDFWRHLKTVQRHRRLVRQYCFRLGLYWQGLTHDLSKFSPVEFWAGVKYFQGFTYCSVFKELFRCCFLFSAATRLFYHTASGLSRTFLIFFSTSFPAVRPLSFRQTFVCLKRQLIKNIIISCVCQLLFYSFFQEQFLKISDYRLALPAILYHVIFYTTNIKLYFFGFRCIKLGTYPPFGINLRVCFP